MEQGFRWSPRAGWPAGRGRQRGLTLVETTVAVGVAAVLMGVAAPSLQATLHRQAIAAEARQFRDGVHRARAEALRRGGVVVLCALDPASDAGRKPLCAATGKDWSGGWLLFLDRDGSGDQGEEDTVLAVHQQLPTVGTVTATLRSISFHPLGFSTSAASHFRFVPPGHPPDARGVSGSLLVCVNKPGRVRLLAADDCA